jgi:hypothetical protein
MRDFDAALKYIDILFPHFPDFDTFSLHSIMKENLTEPDFNKAYDNDAVEILLVNRFLYAKNTKSNLYMSLTDLGIEVKKAGGHLKYLENKKIEEKKKEEIQNLQFEQLDYSVQELQKKLRDYDKVQQRAKDSILFSKVSIGLSIVIPILILMLKWKCNAP